MQNRNLLHQRQYIQNRKKWCWAVCCKLIGEKYKELYPHFNYTIVTNHPKKLGEVKPSEYDFGIPTTDLTGIRWELQKSAGAYAIVDAWQRAIVMNANTKKGIGFEGDIDGDDEAKERGLKYYLTGDTEADCIKIETIGWYQDKKSLLEQYTDQMEEIFQKREYAIGNAILKETEYFHSFVLLSHANHKILLYDPANGSTIVAGEQDAFKQGFQSSIGTAQIKWIQRIIT